MQSLLALKKKLRRLTTTEVLTFYSRIFKTLRKNIHDCKTPRSSRALLYIVLNLSKTKLFFFLSLSEQADNAYKVSGVLVIVKIKLGKERDKK